MLALLAALALGAAVASADDAKPNRIERGAQKVGKGIEKTAKRVEKGVERTVDRTKKGVKKILE